MKIGDKVRFLSEIGGGVIAGFQGRNIVLVEDADGFQIPTPINEVVVANEDEYTVSHLIQNKSSENHFPQHESEDDPADRPITFKKPIEERKGGDSLNAYIAFVPLDIKEFNSTRFESYFINDSNYYMRYTYMIAEGAEWTLYSSAEVEPNTKLFIQELGRDELNSMERICVQIVAYKRNKPFIIKPSIDVQIRLDTVKFYKLHTFKENDFFEQNALIYTIVEKDKAVRSVLLDPTQLEVEMQTKINLDQVSFQQAKKNIKKDRSETPVVVDLHANELLDSVSGLSASEILNYQIDIFHKTLKTYEKKKGTKIIFIHGKGEGVLRSALIKELRYRYKQYIYQDASFQEYGYGATQVTIK